MRPPARLVAALALVAAPLPCPAQTLEAERLAFERWAGDYERHLLELERDAGFLHIDRLERRKRDTARARALRGEPWVGPPELELDRPRFHHTRVHHWVGAIFVPETTLERALAIAIGFERYPAVFADVVDARILARHRDRLDVYLRFTKTKVVTLTYDSEHAVRWQRPAPGRARTWSRATRIRQVESVGEDTERLREPGEGTLHGLHGWWRFEAVAGGVWIENESLVLTDDVSFPASLVVGPLLDAGPREGVEDALRAVRTTLTAARE